MPAFMSFVTLVADSHKEIRYQISIQLLLSIKYNISILKYHLIVTDAVGSSLNRQIQAWQKISKVPFVLS